MRTVILTLLATLGLAVLGGFAFIYSGIYNVGATAPHWPVTYWAMDTVRAHSVKAHAVGIDPPPWLNEESKVIDGTAHFAAHCASCHGAPGVPPGDMAEGLYPKPADLKDVADRYTPAELFWILKNGIKMSAMPTWGDHSDDELWVTVAFLEMVPKMTEQDYGKLIVESMKVAGRHQHGGMAMPDDTSMPPDMPGMDMKNMPMPRAAPAGHGNHQ